MVLLSKNTPSAKWIPPGRCHHVLDEVLQVRPDYIEHQLAHAVKDSNGRAYNRTAHLAERRKMMQLWADYLDGLKVGAKVIPLRKSV